MLAVTTVAVMILPVARLGVYYAHHNRPEWRPAVTYLEQHVADGDVIALYRYGNRYVFDYYYTGRAPFLALGPTSLDRRVFEGWNDRRIAEMMSAIPAGSKRVWFVLSYHESAGGFSIENYISRNYRVLDTKEFERIRIYLAAPGRIVDHGAG